MTNFVDNFHDDAIKSFRKYKLLAERAIEQVSDEEFFVQIDEESNSIALIVQHIAGNQHSRWTDFLTTDGEKPDRDRDREFVTVDDTRESLMGLWESGWQILFNTLDSLTEDDFAKSVTIRGEAHTVVEAIDRQLTHYPYHIGQIVFLAKHLKSTDWKNLSVERNRSAEFNQQMRERHESNW